MTKTSLKFRKNRHKAVGGVPTTLGGRKDRRTEEGRNAEYYVPSLFLKKAGGGQIMVKFVYIALGKVRQPLRLESLNKNKYFVTLVICCMFRPFNDFSSVLPI